MYNEFYGVLAIKWNWDERHLWRETKWYELWGVRKHMKIGKGLGCLRAYGTE